MMSMYIDIQLNVWMNRRRATPVKSTSLIKYIDAAVFMREPENYYKNTIYMVHVSGRVNTKESVL